MDTGCGCRGGYEEDWRGGELLVVVVLKTDGVSPGDEDIFSVVVQQQQPPGGLALAATTLAGYEQYSTSEERLIG